MSQSSKNYYLLNIIIFVLTVNFLTLSPLRTLCLLALCTACSQNWSMLFGSWFSTILFCLLQSTSWRQFHKPQLSKNYYLSSRKLFYGKNKILFLCLFKKRNVASEPSVAAYVQLFRYTATLRSVHFTVCDTFSCYIMLCVHFFFTHLRDAAHRLSEIL